LEISSTAQAAQINRVGTANAQVKLKNVNVDIHATEGHLLARARGLKAISEGANMTGLRVLELEAVRAGLAGNPNLTIIAGEDGIAKSLASAGKILGVGEGKETRK
jgi:hypothetical protein